MRKILSSLVNKNSSVYYVVLLVITLVAQPLHANEILYPINEGEAVMNSLWPHLVDGVYYISDVRAIDLVSLISTFLAGIGAIVGIIIQIKNYFNGLRNRKGKHDRRKKDRKR